MSNSTATENANTTTQASDYEKRRFSLSNVVLNAIEPGVNHSVLMFINIVFMLLILTIVLIIGFLTGYKVYMVLMLILAFGLFIGFNKFVAMLESEEQESKEKEKKN